MPAREEDRARAIFVGVLGMTEISKPAVLPTRRHLVPGCGLELHLGVELDFKPARKAHPGILVDDLGAVSKRLAIVGYSAWPDGNFPGFRRIYVVAPVDNRLEFIEPEFDSPLRVSRRGVSANSTSKPSPGMMQPPSFRLAETHPRVLTIDLARRRR